MARLRTGSSFLFGAEHPFVGHNKGSTIPPLCLFPNADLNPASGQSLDALRAFLLLARRGAYPRVCSSRVCYSCGATPASATLTSHIPNPRLLVSLSLSSSPSLSIYILLYLWRVREFHGFQTYQLSGDLGECSRSRLHLGFPASSGRYVFPFMYSCIWYWAESPCLYMAECQYLDMYCSVANACTRVVSFLHLYHACDILAAL